MTEYNPNQNDVNRLDNELTNGLLAFNSAIVNPKYDKNNRNLPEQLVDGWTATVGGALAQAAHPDANQGIHAEIVKSQYARSLLSVIDARNSGIPGALEEALGQLVKTSSAARQQLGMAVRFNRPRDGENNAISARPDALKAYRLRDE